MATQDEVDALLARARELYPSRMDNAHLECSAHVFDQLYQMNTFLTSVAPPEGAHFFWMSGVQAAVGGQFAHLQFVNPADSGRNIICTQAGLITTTGTSNGFAYGYRAADATLLAGAVELVGAANWVDFRLDETTCPMKVYTASNVANLVAARPIVHRKFLGTNMPRVDSCSIILPPGSSVVFVGQLTATELRVSLEGYAWSV